jgi:hypothetical protein
MRAPAKVWIVQGCHRPTRNKFSFDCPCDSGQRLLASATPGEWRRGVPHMSFEHRCLNVPLPAGDTRRMKPDASQILPHDRGKDVDSLVKTRYHAGVFAG